MVIDLDKIRGQTASHHVVSNSDFKSGNHRLSRFIEALLGFGACVISSRGSIRGGASLYSELFHSYVVHLDWSPELLLPRSEKPMKSYVRNWIYRG